MTESPWERLYRLAEARRSHLGLARNGLQERGGPSTELVRGLKDRHGAPSPRMRRSLDDLDKSLEWAVGTSWSLVTDDRADWSRESLSAEEHDLVRGTGDPATETELSHFATIVLAKLRGMDPERRESAERDIQRLLGI
jgi:hypothetical protein